MIPIILIATAIIGAAVGLTAFFWEEIKQFLKETLKEVKELASRFIQGCRVFLRKIKKGFVTLVNVIAYYYTKRDQIWERIAYREELEESQVPPELLARAGYDRELDITDELRIQLM